MRVIEAENIAKSFPARRGARDLRGRGGLRDWLAGRKAETFEALRDISFSVEQGESLGIIGRNGSGKSTLLSILAGVTLPTAGTVTVRGRVASLLELGAGFHPILTGRENVYLNAGLLGMRHAQTDAVFDEIVKFSGIGPFIDQPVETYSSGMYVRIGFSVAVHSNPDIFLVDEVLSVGDEEFQRRCRRKIGELREQGKTIVFVSHDLGIVNALCGRVVLLSDGRMLDRGSTQKTVNYYLRQVGAEKGTHTFSRGDLEVIQCDGRVSLFHRQEEMSASGGFIMDLASYGQQHFSDAGEWTVEERGDHGCTVRSRMLRLPLELVWKFWIDEAGRFFWDIALECERDTPLRQIGVRMGFPTVYARWLYGDFSGDFPDILPSDSRWTLIITPEVKSCEAALLPAPGGARPPLVCRLTPHNPHFGLILANSEYLSFNRMLISTADYPEHDCVFRAGRHELMRLELDPTRSEGELAGIVRSSRILDCGSLVARFENGAVRLSVGGEELTAYLNLYASMLIRHIWNDSQSLQWGRVREIENGIALTGESRRFPLRQHWELRRRENALDLTVWLEALEEIEVQECHVSVVLSGEYDRWATDHEAGVFPPFDPQEGHWVHFNRTYQAGRSISAWSGRLPSVTLCAGADSPAVRMTAINTTFRENARVLQALRPSEMGRLHFAPGRHLYFSGRILAGAPGGNAPPPQGSEA